MRVVIGIVAAMLTLPIVLLIGIVLGPAILVMLFIGLWAMTVALIEGAWLRHRRDPRVPCNGLT